MATKTLREGLDGQSVPDTYMMSNLPTYIGGSATILGIGYTYFFAHIMRHALFEFDVSVIPAGATINSALVRQYCSTAAASAEAAYLRRCIGNGTPPFENQFPNWVESQCCWNNKRTGVAWTTGGGNWTTTNQAGFNFPTVTGDFDITGVKALVDDGIANRGNRVILLQMRASEASPDAGISVYAGEHATAASRPRLIVDYTIAGAKHVVCGGEVIQPAIFGGLIAR